MTYSLKNLSKKEQIIELAEVYSDYRAAQKEITEIGGLLKASDSLISSLQMEAACLTYVQKVTEIELVPARQLLNDKKTFEKKSRWIKQVEEDKAQLV
jgi:hypothetical protein